MDFNPVCYTTPDFINIPTQVIFHKENEEATANSPIKNYHCLARAKYNYNGEQDVMLRITADDYYKLYVNGEYVCEGPAPSFNNNYYYNEINISPYLNKGINTIAVHLYYQGLVNRVWQSGDNRFCICAMIDGYNLKWKYRVCNAFYGVVTGYDTDFTECFDSRLWDSNWKSNDFDDTEWDYMLCRDYDYSFIKQPTELIDVYEIKPESITKHKDGYIIDAGTEICGGLKLKCKGTAEDVVRIHYAEELNDDGTLRYNLRSGCIYSEEWILTDGANEFESYMYKGFRYVEILTGLETQISIICRHYPFDDNYCCPEFSDDKLRDIFALCKNTVKYATQEGFIDCPTREKGQYLGDAFIAGHSHIILTGKTELVEKCIDDFERSSCICKGFMAVAPCSFMQEIADYSLIFGELVMLVYNYTGNTEFLKKHYYTVKNIILHFSQFQRDDGLLDCVSDKWNMVDWPENLRDDYDFVLSRPVVENGVHNVINAYYLGAISTLNQIEEILEMQKSFDLESLKKAYIKAFFRNGLFADSAVSNHTSLHSNTLALYFNLVPDEHIGNVADFIAKKGFSCGVYFSYFVMKALAKAGRKEDVYRLLTNDGEHGWLNMINEGATTCFEAWGKEQKWNTSLCHPWATAPISVIMEELSDYVISQNE